MDFYGPSAPFVSKTPSYLDAYLRRKQSSNYVKPKVEVIRRTPRDYMETFDTLEPTFRPVRRHINPNSSYEKPWRTSRSSGGRVDTEGRIVHMGTNSTVLTPEVWRPGKRYFIPTSGSWTEPAFKPSLRYIPTRVSDHGVWRPCIRVYGVETPHYYNQRPARRRYLPQPVACGDTYQRLTTSEAYSEVYSPRKLTVGKQEWLGLSNDGVPFLKPCRKAVRMYVHPDLQLFGPDPPIKARRIAKPVTGYFKDHPQLQLFSADFRPDLKANHPAYISKTRYVPEGRVDQFEEGKLTLQPGIFPEGLAPRHIPPHCPSYNEVRANPNHLADIIDVDLLESNKTEANKTKDDEFEDQQPSPTPRPNTVPLSTNKPIQEDADSRFMTEYMRSFNLKKLPETALPSWVP